MNNEELLACIERLIREGRIVEVTHSVDMAPVFDRYGKPIGMKSDTGMEYLSIVFKSSK